jgi:hypothetical protein
VQAVQRLSRGETGQLNLGYLSKFNFDLLPGPLVEFGCTRPEIAVNLLSFVADDLGVALARAGSATACLCLA